MLHTQVILRGTFAIRIQYSYSSVIPSWVRINPDESHFCDVSSDPGWGLQDCPQLHVRATSDALYWLKMTVRHHCRSVEVHIF